MIPDPVCALSAVSGVARRIRARFNLVVPFIGTIWPTPNAGRNCPDVPQYPNILACCQAYLARLR